MFLVGEMKMNKVTAVILALLTVFSILALSSCAKSNATSTASATVSTAKGDTIDSKVLKIGVDNTYPPMEYGDPDTGDTIGFDVDMSKEIAKRLGKTVELIPTQWDGIFQALKTDKYDAIISSVSMTKDRLTEYEFTKPYIANAQMIVVKPSDNSIKKDTDLKGKNVGCQVQTTANDSATYLMDKQGIKFTLKTYDQVIQPFNDMKAGRLDAVIVDEVVGQYYIATDSKNYKAAAVKLTNEPIGACFKKGNTVLRDEVQKAIDAMVADGSMKKLSNKWFKKDLTSNIDPNLKTLGD
jgi:polar amino acid transport system substrate-binding protein